MVGEGHGGAEATSLVCVDVGVERRRGGDPAAGGGEAEDARVREVGCGQGRGDGAAAGHVGLADEEEEEPPPAAAKLEQEEHHRHHLVAQQGASSGGGGGGSSVAAGPWPEAYAQYYYSARADHDASAMVSALAHVIRASADQQQPPQQAFYPAGPAAASPGDQQLGHAAEEQGT